MIKKLFFIAIIALTLTGCFNPGAIKFTIGDTVTSTSETNIKNMIKISSTAFASGKALPLNYTCDGESVNPPLNINSAPFAAKSLALIADDPDASRGTFTHWIIFNLDPSTRIIPTEAKLAGSVVGKNDFGKSEYGAPCPPSGTHRYYFRIYALDIKLDLPAGSTRAQVDAAMKDHIMENSEIFATYKR